MNTTDGTLKCDMEKDCEQTVTHIDNKGYVYCREHGIERKSYRPCRMLKPKELAQLKTGTPLASY